MTSIVKFNKISYLKILFEECVKNADVEWDCQNERNDVDKGENQEKVDLTNLITIHFLFWIESEGILHDTYWIESVDLYLLGHAHALQVSIIGWLLDDIKEMDAG